MAAEMSDEKLIVSLFAEHNFAKQAARDEILRHYENCSFCQSNLAAIKAAIRAAASERYSTFQRRVIDRASLI